ncbi:hypothetical protein [Breoghania sp.]|uniref:hypothetical protein n=1 Tax=Breoghania sp. TaxID=2065378 RepID=UPI002631C843|nr:hypothetical protein [Breoghania sp.]MDJ0932620.1 hypothetical protein [Breoghania sp.]
MNRRKEREEERQREAREALDRIHGDSETVGSSSFVRVAKHAQDHFTADDKQGEKDPVEIWGSRIGRAGGLLFALALVLYLVVTYF